MSESLVPTYTSDIYQYINRILENALEESEQIMLKLKTRHDDTMVNVGSRIENDSSLMHMRKQPNRAASGTGSIPKVDESERLSTAAPSGSRRISDVSRRMRDLMNFPVDKQEKNLRFTDRIYESVDQKSVMLMREYSDRSNIHKQQQKQPEYNDRYQQKQQQKPILKDLNQQEPELVQQQAEHSQPRPESNQQQQSQPRDRHQLQPELDYHREQPGLEDLQQPKLEYSSSRFQRFPLEYPSSRFQRFPLEYPSSRSQRFPSNEKFQPEFACFNDTRRNLLPSTDLHQQKQQQQEADFKNLHQQQAEYAEMRDQQSRVIELGSQQIQPSESSSRHQLKSNEEIQEQREFEGLRIHRPKVNEYKRFTDRGGTLSPFENESSSSSSPGDLIIASPSTYSAEEIFKNLADINGSAEDYSREDEKSEDSRKPRRRQKRMDADDLEPLQQNEESSESTTSSVQPDESSSSQSSHARRRSFAVRCASDPSVHRGRKQSSNVDDQDSSSTDRRKRHRARKKKLVRSMEAAGSLERQLVAEQQAKLRRAMIGRRRNSSKLSYEQDAGYDDETGEFEKELIAEQRAKMQQAGKILRRKSRRSLNQKHSINYKGGPKRTSMADVAGRQKIVMKGWNPHYKVKKIWL